MSDSATVVYHFATSVARDLEARFDGGHLTSDGGLPWLAEAEAELQVCSLFARCLTDWRKDPSRSHHSLEMLVRQRVFQMACGYQDQDDADTLRSDPLFKLVCGQLPASGHDLASQPTLSRLENCVDRRTCHRLAETLAALYLRARDKDGPPRRILLDCDSTADPTHGDQEGSAYHGYYRQHMYHPLLVFDGDTQHLIAAILRPGTVHASRFVVLILRRLIRLLRARWPGVPIELRADSGFAIPRLYRFCDRENIVYTIGLATNSRLTALAKDLLAEAMAQQKELLLLGHRFGEQILRQGREARVGRQPDGVDDVLPITEAIEAGNGKPAVGAQLDRNTGPTRPEKADEAAEDQNDKAAGVDGAGAKDRGDQVLGVTIEDEQRVIHMLAVIAMVGGPLLIAVGRVSGAVAVEEDASGRTVLVPGAQIERS